MPRDGRGKVQPGPRQQRLTRTMGGVQRSLGALALTVMLAG